jgi:hypothetical protein
VLKSAGDLSLKEAFGIMIQALPTHLRLIFLALKVLSGEIRSALGVPLDRLEKNINRYRFLIF